MSDVTRSNRQNSWTSWYIAYNVTRTDRAQDFVEGSEEGSVDTERGPNISEAGRIFPTYIFGPADRK